MGRQPRRASSFATLALVVAAFIAVAPPDRAGAIKGGHLVSGASFPYLTQLVTAHPGGGYTLLCSGTLIDPSWVLTAGHCGVHFVNAPRSLLVAVGGVVQATVDGVYVQPGWASANGVAFVNDTALVHLSTPDTVHPVVELARSSDASRWDPCGATRTIAGCGSELPSAGQVVDVLGFGGCDGPCTSVVASVNAGVLREATLHMLSYSALRNAYAQSSYAPYVSGALDGVIVGAGVSGGAADSCGGDSGGPLLVPTADGALREVALTSWAEGACGQQVANGVYMQLGAGAARRWIESLVPSVLDPAAAGTASGYWLARSDGGVTAFGAAPHLGSASAHAVQHLEPTPNGRGYWIVDAAGHVFARGNARPLGAVPELRPGEWVVSLSSTPTGNGYWIFTSFGRVFAYGDAQFFGDLARVRLNGLVVASVATPTGRGYYLIGTDGGVFAFGDAHFRGSMGGVHLNRPVIGIAPTPDNNGYWLVASDGGIFAFDAPFRGSLGAVPLQQPIRGMVAFGNGYLLVASDGGVFDFSNQPFFGSLAGTAIPAPIAGIAPFAG